MILISIGNFQYFLKNILKRDEYLDKIIKAVKSDRTDIINNDNDGLGLSIVKNFNRVKEKYESIMISVSKKLDVGDRNQYLYKSKLLKQKEISQNEREAKLKEKCKDLNGKENHDCKKFTVSFEEFKDALGTEEDYDFNAGYRFILIKWIQSKIPTRLGANMENVYDFHVVRMAILTYYRAMYIVFESIITTLLDKMKDYEKGQKTEAYANVKILTHELDKIFTRIINDENQLQWDGENVSGSLAQRYNHIKELSKNNKALSQSIQNSNNSKFQR